MPRGSSGNPKLAASAARRRSQSRASAKPPASAAPLTAATTGRAQLATARKQPMLVSTRRSRCSRSPPNWVVSIPEQKAGGAPVSTTAPTPGSSPSDPKHSASSTRRSIERALRFSGRCRVTTATSSRRSRESRPAIRGMIPSQNEGGTLKSHTDYMTFNTEGRREFVRITENVQAAVDSSGVSEGMVLVSAMHITAAVWVNDDEPGLQEDTLEWLDKIAPPSWKEPANDVARQLVPDPGDYRHHRGGEDNGDAHLKNLLVHHQVVLPITEGRLDLGPWQAVFYCEFDGRRSKRLVIKVIGD